VQSGPQSPWIKEASPQAAKAPAVHTLFQPLANGFYDWQTQNGQRWLAVNTFSTAESDLRAAGTPTSAPIELPTVSLARLAGWPLWQYLAAAALLLFALEWWLFHRRRTE
jgi:hypothetical protein